MQTNQNNPVGQARLENIKNKKNQLIQASVLLVVILAIFVFTNKKSNAPVVSTVAGCVEGDEFSKTTGEPCFPETSGPCQNGEEFDRVTGEPCSLDGNIVSNNALSTNSSNTSSSYDVVLKEYMGKRFLFDSSCVSTPVTLEVPVGTRILVSNNGNVGLDLSIQGRKENLSAYHYMTSSMKTAGEFPVSCNGKNSATVVVK